MSGPPRSRASWLGRAIALVAGAAVGLLMIFGWNPDGGGPTVHAQFLGDLREVLLVEPQHGVEVQASVDAQGRVQVTAPARAERPVLEAYAAGSSALVQSGPLELSEAKAGEVQVEPLALWEPSLELQVRDDVFRLRWSPIKSGPGYPKQRLYSVLVTYRKKDGERSESSLRTTEPELQMTIGEFLSEETLPERDPGRMDVELELRVFDPTIRVGPKWIGARHLWTIGSPELRPWTRSHEG